MRTNIFTALIATVLLFTSCNLVNDKPKTDIFKTIPDNSIVIIDINDVTSLSEELYNNDIWNSVPETNLKRTVQEATSVIERADSLSVLYKSLMSLHAYGRQNSNFIFYIQTREFISKSDVESMSADIFRGNISRTADYNGNKVYKCKNNNNVTTWFITAKDDILIFTKHEQLLKKSIREYDVNKDVVKLNGLKNAVRTAGSHSSVNIYVHFPSVSGVIAKKYRNGKGSVADFIIANGDWCELDLSIKDDALVLNGFTNISDRKRSVLSTLLAQNNHTLTYNTILPVSARSFCSVWLDNQELFLSDKLRAGNTTVTKIDSIVSVIIRDHIKEEMVYAQIGDKSQKLPDDVIIFSLKSPSVTSELIQSQLGDVCEETTVTSFMGNKYRGYKILGQSSLTKWFAPDSLITAVVFKDYLVASGSGVAIKTVIDDYESGSVREKSAFVEKVNTHSSGKSSVDLVTNSLKYIGVNIPLMIKWQIVTEDNHLYNNIILSKEPAVKKHIKRLNEINIKLDTLSVFTPAVVKNHKNKGVIELFCQDNNNSIYLVSDKGKVLWKRDVTGDILSAIYQVDVYKNNKLQYLFNTKDFIYIIDRNGNNVDGYPVRIKGGASAGLSLFDYDKNRKYRYFVPGINKKIMVFDIKGKRVKGWKYSNTENKLDYPIKHFVSNKKDYIVFADKNRVYMLNRRGEERVKIGKPFSKPINNDLFISKNKESLKLITSDITNNIISVDINGKIKEMFAVENDLESAPIIVDIDSDSDFDVISCNDNTIYIYDSNGDDRKLIEIEDIKVTDVNILYSDKEMFFIECLDNESKRRFIINNKGEIIKKDQFAVKPPLKIYRGNNKNTIFYKLSS
jgi:hypothetical protein